MADLFTELPARRIGIGGHQSPASDTDTWLTPPRIIRALGGFDLDPCAAPEPRPWSTAAEHWTRGDFALSRSWHGRVWLNPPYGRRDSVSPWLRRMAEHDDGIALIFARTETEIFFETVWARARAILFLKGRLTFYRPDGRPAGGNGGAPSVLIAYGARNARLLEESGIAGKFLPLVVA